VANADLYLGLVYSSYRVYLPFCKLCARLESFPVAVPNEDDPERLTPCPGSCARMPQIKFPASHKRLFLHLEQECQIFVALVSLITVSNAGKARTRTYLHLDLAWV
jgi:hypothetical protein